MTQPTSEQSSTVQVVICEHAVDLRFSRCLLCEQKQRPSKQLREFWVCVQPMFHAGDAYSSRALAEEAMVEGDLIVHVREVPADVAADD